MHIYLFINKIDGKKYVGQTIRKPDARFLSHRQVSRCPKQRDKQMITKAIHKYGWDNFTRHVLEICHSQDELNEAEKFWIQHYDCMVPNGYNLETGGNRGGKLSEETRKKMSIARLGNSNRTGVKSSSSALENMHSAQQRRRAKEASDPNFVNTTSTPETNAKRSAAVKEYWRKKREAEQNASPSYRT